MNPNFAGRTGAGVRVELLAGAAALDFLAKLPPCLDDVVARGMILTAVAYRGWSEARQRTKAQKEEIAGRLVCWLDRFDLLDQLEPEEARVLSAQADELSPEEALGAAWRLEGAVVMAWAARVMDIPRFNELAQLPGVLDVMDDVPAGRLPAGPIRDEGEVLALMRHTMGLLDTVERSAVIAEAEGFENHGNWMEDLDLAGYPLARTRHDDRDLLLRTAFERAKATRWLIGLGSSYTDVGVPLKASGRRLV